MPGAPGLHVHRQAHDTRPLSHRCADPQADLFSYCVSGALIALALDLTLLLQSAITLDYVMRALWRPRRDRRCSGSPGTAGPGR
ncbi:MAG: hypothetical protein ACREYB_04580 [Casimicrobiaceae bacterium]